MLNWIVTFFALAILASILGFSGLAGTLVGIIKLVAISFVILFAASLIYALLIDRRTSPPLV